MDGNWRDNYRGLVQNGEITTRIPTGKKLTPYGFYSEADPLAASLDPNFAIIGITGGSVSEYFFGQATARDILRSYLEKLPRFQNKKLIFCQFGMIGYAEPQQFFSVSYYLIHGGRLDLLINLDGVNEADNYVENQSFGIYPDFPWKWRQFRREPSLEDLALQEDVMEWKRRRSTLANAYDKTSFSVTASTIWALIDKYINTRAVLAETHMMQAHTAHGYSYTGPATMSKATTEMMIDFTLKIWSNASLQLNNLALQNHFAYFHFLQPNQYVTNSKTLSPAERRTAFDSESRYAKLIPTTYNRIQSKIPQLYFYCIRTISSYVRN